MANAFLDGKMPKVGLNLEKPLIYLATEKKSGLQVIAKVIYKTSARHAGTPDKLELLCSRLLKLDYHPLLLTIYGVYVDAERIYIISEALKGPELYHFLLTEEVIPEELCKHIIRQILLALEFLHTNGIVHRDVKPENLVFRIAAGKHTEWPLLKSTQSLESEALQRVKDYLNPFELVLIDLDTADTQQSHLVTGVHTRKKQVVGTYSYMAPEILYGAAPSPTTDLWGVGIILYILITGRLPTSMNRMKDLQTTIAVHEDITRRGGLNFDVYPFREFSQAKSLCKQLLEYNADKRLQNATEALEHPWIASTAPLDSQYYIASTVTPWSLRSNVAAAPRACARTIPPRLPATSAFTMPPAIVKALRPPATPLKKMRQQYKEISAVSTAVCEESDA